MTTELAVAQAPRRLKLVGWKMIGRHLGRSERAVQFWEEQRGLPIHRIPGGRGQTVFAYADELDAWMNRAPDARLDLVSDLPRPHAEEATAMHAVGGPLAPSSRAPGILVIPGEPDSTNSRNPADLLCQQLIVRMSAIQPIRVSSWTNSRSIASGTETVEDVRLRLNIRYLVESSIERSVDVTHVEVRIIDADCDQLMIADRFAINTADTTAFSALAESVALHFALVYAGALVEPICLGNPTPTLLTTYLCAARSFFDDERGSTGRALSAVDRVLATHPEFAPAQALRGLALLQCMQTRGDDSVRDEARRIFAACADDTAARVSAAFLGAAVIKYAAPDRGLEVAAEKTALRWIPPRVAREGRLYDRRSATQGGSCALGVSRGDAERRSDDRCGGAAPHALIGELLRELVAMHARDVRRDPFHALPRVDGNGLD